MKKILIPIIIILAIVVIIFVAKDKPVDPLVPDPETADVIEAGASGQFAKIASNGIIVGNQQVNDEVILSMVAMEKGGFVSIHAYTNDDREKIIGISRYLTAGSYQNLEIGLTEKIINQHGYYAQLHQDDGNGIFDPMKDNQVIGFDRKPVVSEFTGSIEAEDPRDTVIYY